jgi:hypothetical protein
MPDQFANSATDIQPEVREEMRRLFNLALTEFEKQARRNNLANAFGFICAASLQVKTGREPTDTETDQLIAFFNNNLAASPQFRTFDARQRQMLYESLIIIGGVVLFLDAKGKELNNPQLRAQATAMSNAVLKSFLGIQ